MCVSMCGCVLLVWMDVWWKLKLKNWMLWHQSTISVLLYYFLSQSASVFTGLTRDLDYLVV